MPQVGHWWRAQPTAVLGFPGRRGPSGDLEPGEPVATLNDNPSTRSCRRRDCQRAVHFVMLICPFRPIFLQPLVLGAFAGSPTLCSITVAGQLSSPQPCTLFKILRVHPHGKRECRQLVQPEFHGRMLLVEDPIPTCWKVPEGLKWQEIGICPARLVPAPAGP